MGLRRLNFGSQPSTEKVLEMPDGAESLLSFSFVGTTGDGLAGEYHQTAAVLSNILSKIYSDFAAGDSAGLLAVANQTFPAFPVSAGERLLVAMEAAGSGVIFISTTGD